MKNELLIVGLTAFLIFNAYHDNKYLNKLKTFKKYYSMAFIGFTGLSLYLFSKKYPAHAFQGIHSARQLLTTIPFDKSSHRYFDTFLTTNEVNVSPLSWLNDSPPTSIPSSASPPTTIQPSIKRSVSETKKKYVASQQEWKCGHCKSQLNAWFEVDHIQSLEYGGSNHISNLVALCRECHGKKTALERMGI